MSARRRFRLLVVVLATTLLTACSVDVPGFSFSPGIGGPSSGAPSSGAPAAAPAGAVPTGDAATALTTIPVRGRAPQTGYDREQFGQRWADVDHNGCDQRNDTLTRDLTEVALREGSGCVVATGSLADPYTGELVPFTRGEDTSDDVQIDHVVALSNAWQTGAQQLSPAVRETFANDPLNLQAVDGGVNASKGDGDAATWLPPDRGYWCTYVSQQVAVKAKYGLWMTAAESQRIGEILTSCPGQPLPADSGVAVPA